MRTVYLMASVLVFLILLRPGSLSAADLPRTWVEVIHPATGAVLLEVEAERAASPETRTRGLMDRSSLPANQGMLFIFDSPQPLSFWMFNTLIPLDIIFADERRRIVTIHASVPPCLPPRRCPTYPSHSPAQFVLEINGGLALKAGIAVGDELRWVPKSATSR
ncbi:MAG: DUF192 domain-containing protein [Nitrospinae bacterium]|nr:DUF192 domain-containing protein [Nitrospinota bacterium]